MDDLMAERDEAGGPDPERRALLTGLTAACLAPLVPPAFAQAASGQDNFLAVSKVLTGRPSLDLDQATRLYGALAADDPAFETEVRSLLAWMDDRRIDAAQLQRTLDAEGSALAALPRKIVGGWYTGIVGEGARARCVTFETSLMHQVVADRLGPPSYCYGGHGAWAEAPV
jgi:hypothetical protein